MSQSSKAFTGRPNTDSKDTVRVLLYCGGGGAGGCPDPLGAEGMVIPIRVPRFITYNRKIVINNNESFGFRIFIDAGSDGLCSSSLGAEKSFFMGLAADPGLNIETTAKAGLELSGALPYEVEFPADLCPQPTDPAWENIVYVYVWWGLSTYVNEAGFDTARILLDMGSSLEAITIIKHDKDSKQ